jgi:hypothetical protein
MTKKPTAPRCLEDIAHIFKGVAHRDVFEGKRTKEAPHDAPECIVLHAKDLSQGRFWFGPRSTGKVSRRVVEKAIRGVGSKAVLQPGDIVISNRGKPATSPVLTSEMLGGIPMVAGTELLVIRSRTDNGPYYFPAHIRNLIEHPESTEYLEKKSVLNEANRSLVFSKETLGGLPIGPMRRDSMPHQDESNERSAFAEETSAGKSLRIMKAIVRSGSRRINQQPPSTKRPNIDHSELSWYASDDVHSLEREPEAAQKVAEAILSFGGLAESTPDAEKLGKRICELAKAKDPAKALIGGHEGFEALTLLVHGGDPSCSPTHTNYSVRDILSECARDSADIAIEASEAGHTAFEVAKKAKRARSITLLEDNENYSKVARASVALAAPKVEIKHHSSIFAARGDSLYDVVLFEAAARVKDKAGKRAEDLGVAGIFNWNGYMTKLKPGGKMVIHVPTKGWERLSGIRHHISSIVQLPPLVSPERHALPNQYTPCSQGLLVTVTADCRQEHPVLVVDATKSFDGGKPSISLPNEIVTALARVALGDRPKIKWANSKEMSREELFRKFPKVWPGMLTLTNTLPDDETLSICCTLETLLEEYQFHDAERAKNTNAIFNGMGIHGVTERA